MGLLFIIFVWVILCFVAAGMGEGKSCGFWGAFIYSLLLTPLIGFIIVLASGESAGRKRARIRSEERYRMKVREEIEAEKQQIKP